MKLKKIALALFVLIISSACLTADETHGWAVVYKVKEVDPTMSYLMICGPDNPGCNTVYRDVEKTRWFATREQVFDLLNGFWDEWSGAPIEKTYINSKDPVPPRPMAAERIIGIFECKRIPIHLQKIGTHKVTVEEPKEIEQDLREWQPQ